MLTKLDITGLAILTALFVVWPIPGTFSIRDSLIVLGCITFIALVRRSRGQASVSLTGVLYPTAFLVTLTLWMLVVALWVTNETAWSLNEMRGQWFKGLVTYALGLLVALSLVRNPALSKYVVPSIAAILLLHIIYVDITAIQPWTQGVFSFRAVGLTSGPDKASYLTNILFAFLIAEVLLRWQRRTSFLPVPGAVLYVAIAAAIVSVVAERTRNGVIALTIMIIVALLLASGRFLRRFSIASVFGLAAVLMLGLSLLFLAASFKPGVGAQHVFDTVAVALDTSANKAWIDTSRYPLPMLPDGRPVDESTYLRVAWLKEGSTMLFENPLGLGFGRNAFGHGLMDKYGEGKGHSHSGLLDLAIGVGIPGTVLWLGFLLSLVVIARRELSGDRAHYAVPLLLLVVDFSVRMAVDGIIRDHMIQMFMFLAALLLGLTVFSKSSSPRTRAAAV